MCRVAHMITTGICIDMSLPDLISCYVNIIWQICYIYDCKVVK